MSARYAIYLAPTPDSALWRRACAWLGRDAAADMAVPFAGPPSIDPGFAAAITADARGYGFHATLKAPFRLAAGTTPEALHAAADRFARTRRRFPIALRLSVLGSFLALTEERQSDALATLHAEALAAFEPFRAPPSEADQARRLGSRLTDRQRAHLAQWGYPYVLEDFRLHFTLTGALEPDRRAAAEAALADHFALDLTTPFLVDAICLFEQPAAGAPFRVLHRAPFAAA